MAREKGNGLSNRPLEGMKPFEEIGVLEEQLKKARIEGMAAEVLNRFLGNLANGPDKVDAFLDTVNDFDDMQEGLAALRNEAQTRVTDIIGRLQGFIRGDRPEGVGSPMLSDEEAKEGVNIEGIRNTLEREAEYDVISIASEFCNDDGYDIDDDNISIASAPEALLPEEEISSGELWQVRFAFGQLIHAIDQRSEEKAI